MGNASEPDWADTTVEERAHALRTLYLTQPGEEVEVEDGTRWWKLAVTNLPRLGAVLSGLTEGSVHTANAWLHNHGLRRSTGTGRTTKHFIKILGDAAGNAAVDASELPDDDDLLVIAAATITNLRAKVEALEAELVALRAKTPAAGLEALRRVLNS